MKIGAWLTIAAAAAILLTCFGPTADGVSAATAPAGHTRQLHRLIEPARAMARPSSSASGQPNLAVAAGVGSNLFVASGYTTTAASYDPTAHANLFAASNALGIPPVGAFRSADGGTTWAANTAPLPSSAPNSFAAEPGPAFEASGGLSYTYLGVATTATTVSTQLVVSRSTDKGATWGLPVTVDSQANGPDKPLMAVDQTSGAFHGRRYVAYDRNPSSNLFAQPIVVARSDDGISWSKTQVWDSGGDIGAFPVVGPNGEVYVAWNDYCGGVQISTKTCQYPPSGYSSLRIAKSTDGGVTFAALGQSPVVASNTNIGFATNIPNYSNTLCTGLSLPILTLPSLAVDDSNGPYHGSLYIAWADQRLGMHIFLSASRDGGAQWSAPVRMDLGNGHEAWEPAVAVDRSTGVLTMAWYDRRDDPNDKLYRVYYTESVDGGATFLSSPIPTSTAGSDPTLNCTGTGEYMQMVAVDGVAHPLWADTRNGVNQIFTAAVDEIAVEQNEFAPSFFSPPVPYQAGTSPGGLVLADFNGDGKPDVALGNGAMFFSSGSGVLAAQPNENVTGVLGAGDFNNDGKQDLVVSAVVTLPGGYIQGGIAVALGHGDGTFTLQTPIGIGGFVPAVAVGDFNGDGKLDIAAASGPDAPHSVAVMLGNGDGTFKSPVDYAAVNGPSAIVTVDFHGNGKLDIAVEQPGRIAVLPGNGDGTFQPAVIYTAGNYLSSSGPLAVADVNGDGHPDLITDQGVLLNLGSGNFGSFIPLPGQASYYGSLQVAAGHFTGSGRVDLVLSNPISLFRGNGDGTFQSSITFRANGGSVVALGVADLNADGTQDLITTTNDSTVTKNLTVLFGGRAAVSIPGAITFAPQPILTASSSQVATVTNSSLVSTHIALAHLAGRDAEDFSLQSDYCSGQSLPPGSSCAVSLTFVPRAYGSRTVSLVFNDDAVGSPQSIPLSGIGGLLPGSPTGVRALAGDSEASLAWEPPASNGGSALSSYTIIVAPGGASTTVSALIPAATFTGLNNGTAYTFTVSASNASGPGPPSLASATVTPTAVAQGPSVAVLPAMSNGAYGGYLTAAYLENLGAGAAHVRVQYFDTSGHGSGSGNSLAALPPGAIWTLRTDNGDSVPATQAGSAVVYSDQPLGVFVNEFAPRNASDATSYTAISVPSGTGATLYAPAIANNAYGGYTTGIGLVNLSASAVNITVTYRDTSGTVAKAQTLNNVAGGAYQGLYSGDAALGLPAGFAGTATITSSGGNLAAVINETGPGNQFSSYDAVPAGSTTLYAPVALNNAFGGYNTGMAIENTTGSAGIVTISYYDNTGAATTKTFPIVADGYLGVYQGTDIPLPGAYTAKITSTVAIAAVVNEVAPSSTTAKQSTAYNTFGAGSGTLHLPLVESTGADGWSTGEGIMNTGSSATTVTVTYYDPVTGLQVGTADSQLLQPNAFWGLYQPAGGLPNGARASAVITTTGQPVAVICNESNSTSFMSYSGQ